MRTIGQVGAMGVSVSHGGDSPPHRVCIGGHGLGGFDAPQARALAALLRSAAGELDAIERRKLAGKEPFR